jgi:hypothetical protein
VRVERVGYDAEAVAAEMRRVGLPDELATKLALATRKPSAPTPIEGVGMRVRLEVRD